MEAIVQFRCRLHLEHIRFDPDRIKISEKLDWFDLYRFGHPNPSESPRSNRAELLIFLIPTHDRPQQFFGSDRVRSSIGVEARSELRTLVNRH